MIKGIIQFIVMLIILFVGIESYAQERFEDIDKARAEDIEIKAFLKESRDCDSQHTRYYIKFELKNKSSKTVKINKTYLPWGNGISLFVDSTLLDNSERLEEIRPLPCLQRCDEIIEPNETIIGYRDLNLVHKDLGIIDFDKITRLTDVLIKWGYSLSTVPINDETCDFSGQFLIPKHQ